MTFEIDRRKTENDGRHPRDASSAAPARSRSIGSSRSISKPRSGAGSSGQATELESESLLSERFAISRITVRQAIDDLVRKQIVVRKQGKGTFVTQPDGKA